MLVNQEVFKRYEKKYMLDTEQYKALNKAIVDRFVPNRYARATISNIYFDTEDYRLIRQSLEKPVYKEKLRLRSYSVPEPDSEVFIELKKKYRGIVYKRRIDMSYNDAYGYLYRGEESDIDSQIKSELDYFIDFYGGLKPAMYIGYDRTAIDSKEDSGLRITFDSNIIWRNEMTDLSSGRFGERLIDRNHILMEIKIPHALPCYLCRILDRLEIRQCSFSKYGMAYTKLINKNRKEVFCCA